MPGRRIPASQERVADKHGRIADLSCLSAQILFDAK